MALRTSRALRSSRLRRNPWDDRAGSENLQGSSGLHRRKLKPGIVISNVAFRVTAMSLCEGVYSSADQPRPAPNAGAAAEFRTAQNLNVPWTDVRSGEAV